MNAYKKIPTATTKSEGKQQITIIARKMLFKTKLNKTEKNTQQKQKNKCRNAKWKF